LEKFILIFASLEGCSKRELKMDYQCHKFYYDKNTEKNHLGFRRMVETMIDNFHTLLERNFDYAPVNKS